MKLFRQRIEQLEDDIQHNLNADGARNKQEVVSRFGEVGFTEIEDGEGNSTLRRIPAGYTVCSACGHDLAITRYGASCSCGSAR